MTAPAPVTFTSLVDPTPRQWELWDAVDAKRYVLYGGARGGGKSYILRWTAVRLLIQWFQQGHRGVRVGVFCEDYPTLQDRQIAKVKVEFPQWLGTWNEQRKEYTLKKSYGGGVICFRNLDEPSKYQSSEFAAILVEELTKNPVQTFDILRGSLRWPGIEETKFVAATNPGGIGHLWVRDYWVNGRFPKEMQNRADQFAFVQSLPSDNPHLAAGYWEELNSLPEHLRKAWVEGSWDVFEGQAFSEWSREQHVTTVSPRPDDPEWTWFAGLDWGYRDPAVLVLFAQHREGDILARKEVVVREKTPFQFGKLCGEVLNRFPLPEWILGDSSMWAVSDGGPTYATEFARGLAEALPNRAPPLAPSPKGRGSRVARVNRMHEMLRWSVAEDGEVKPWTKPRLRFHEKDCPTCIATIPALPVDQLNHEDIDTDADDHAFDAVTYALMGPIKLPDGVADADGPTENRFPGFDPQTGARKLWSWQQALKAPKPRFNSGVKMRRRRP